MIFGRLIVLSVEEFEKKRKIYFDIINAMKDYSSSCLVGIYGVVNNDEGILVGTGTYIKLQKKLYIITARHVLEECDKYKNVAILQSNGKPPLLLEGKQYRSDPPLDIGLCEVNENMVNLEYVKPVDLQNIADSSGSIENEVLFIHGFPGQYSHFTAFFERAIITESFPYGSEIGKHSYEWFKDAKHFAFAYPSDGNFAENNERKDLPNPPGLSGSAIWALYQGKWLDKWTPDKAKIIGIAYMWDQHAQSLIAIRVEEIRKYLVSVGLIEC